MNGKTFFAGMAAGSMAGAILGMLFAPQSGKETQNQIRETTEHAKQCTSDSMNRIVSCASHAANRGKEILQSKCILMKKLSLKKGGHSQDGSHDLINLFSEI